MKTRLVYRHLLSACLLFAAGPELHAQNNFSWEKAYRGHLADQLTGIAPTSDGGFIATGTSYSDTGLTKTGNNRDINLISSDYWIVKCDLQGNVQWEKTYGGVYQDWTGIAREHPLGGYIIAGSSMSGIGADKTDSVRGGGGWADYWIIRTDAQGNLLWEKTIGGPHMDIATDVIVTSDMGFLVGGYSRSAAGGEKTQGNHDVSSSTADYWIVKLDVNGNIQWDKRYGGIEQEALDNLVQTWDGGFILSGTSSSGVSGERSQPNWDGSHSTFDFWIIKTDSAGTIIWERRYGGTDEEYMVRTVEVMTGPNTCNYYLCGATRSDVGGDKTKPCIGPYTLCNDSDFWILKISENGTLLWDRVYGGFDVDRVLNSAMLTSTNRLLIGGSSRSNAGGTKTQNNASSENSWVIELDTAGNQLWDKTLMTQSPVGCGYAIELNGGCYAMGNYNNALVGGDRITPAAQMDYWMVGACNIVSAPAETPSTASACLLSASGAAQLRLALYADNQETFSITVSDLLGRTLYSGTTPCSGSKTVTIDLPPGTAGLVLVRAAAAGRQVMAAKVLAGSN